MSNITVIQRTQRIVVDPASRAVSVINEGPQGPAGPTGGVGGVGPAGPAGPPPVWELFAEYTTPGTTAGITLPVDAIAAYIRKCDSGSGGGAGRKGAAGTVRCGGGAGAGGANAETLLTGAILDETFTVVIPAGGAGAAATTTNDTNGANGSPGAPATVTASVSGLLFGGLAGLPTAGSGGSNVSGAGGVSTAGESGTANGGPAATNGGAGVNGAIMGNGPSGGGSGGGIDAANTPNVGGASGFIMARSGGNAAGGAINTSGTTPAAASAALRQQGHGWGGGGSGGGASITGNAGNGAAGQSPGGGGGGGGAALNGVGNGGAGGAGAPGYVGIWVLRQQTAGPITTGTGSPEGVVTAPVGTEYTDTAATNGAIKWVKASGVGNTGWVVVYGDTGWRKILSWTAGVQDGTNQIGTISATGFTLAGTGSIMVRRIGRNVYFSCPNTQANSPSLIVTGPTNLLTAANWPLGFRPPNNFRSAALARAAASSEESVDFAGSLSHLRIGSPTVPKPLIWATAKWVTDDSWPTGALPGVAG